MIRKIKIVHNGQEKEYDVIFSYCSENDGKNYIVYTDYEVENNLLTCYSALYEDDKILPVDDIEELKSIEVVLKTLNNRYSISKLG